MASRISGITVEIGGDTTKLTDALKDVNRTISGTQAQLRDVEKLLKLDPTNTELLAQKQKLLTDAVEATSDKLDALKSAAEQAQEQLADGRISQQQFDALQREIIATEQSLQDYQQQLQDVDESLSRYVTIGISCDTSDNVRACKLEVKSGTAATSPEVPLFTNTDNKIYLTLAAVYLSGGATKITKIRDYRENEKYCGYVKCVLGKCRVSEMLVAMTLLSQQTEEMTAKIDTLQSTVDMLQLKVDDLTGDIILTGSLGEDIYYVLYSNGNLLVRGTGEMYDYDTDSNLSPFRGNNDIQAVVVDEGITSVGDCIFGNCQNMEKISLPTTLTSIGQAAFMQGDGYAIPVLLLLTTSLKTSHGTLIFNHIPTPHTSQRLH